VCDRGGQEGLSGYLEKSLIKTPNLRGNLMAHVNFFLIYGMRVLIKRLSLDVEVSFS
jgi:hypothetical protein